MGIVPVLKPSRDVRICIDLAQIIKNVLCECYVLPTVEDSLGLLSGASVFLKLDVMSGIYQIKLLPEGRLLTTFITPFGRYCFQGLPFGITSAPKFFQNKMLQIVEGTPSVVNMIDDVLIYGCDKAQHDDHLRLA